MDVNPIIGTDYPDPDVIRVDDAYYMVSTTMHFFPGGAVLKSYDLIHWELINYLFDSLDDLACEEMAEGEVMYGGGMWAPSLRYYDGVFYVAFVSHYSETTYLFTSKDPGHEWKKGIIEGYYHDCSLLFDDDGRKYIVSGNSKIKITELKDDLSGPKEGGLERILVEEHPDAGLGYEGSHLYKIGGFYYLFLIHWASGHMRSECCFVSDSLSGEFHGGEVLECDRNYCGQGVAQGGVVDDPAGNCYGIMFQDSGAVGRIPILVPVTIVPGELPVFGNEKKSAVSETDRDIPKCIETMDLSPGHVYEPVYTSEIFEESDFDPEGSCVTCRIKKQWQWNHRPQNNLWYRDEKGCLVLTTDRICDELTFAVNTLTQRMMWPGCEGSVNVDASGINEGDVAGLCALCGEYSYLAITKENGEFYLVRVDNMPQCPSVQIGIAPESIHSCISEKIRLDVPKIRIAIRADFYRMADNIELFAASDEFADSGDSYRKIGPGRHISFRLDHFVGVRFGLFMFSAKHTGGCVRFNDFEYRPAKRDDS